MNDIPKIFREKELTSGYIYVIQSDKYYKIGITTNIKERMDALQTSNPIEIRLILCQKHKDYKNMEQWLHKELEASCIRGEWFLLDDDQVEWVAKIFTKYMIRNPRL